MADEVEIKIALKSFDDIYIHLFIHHIDDNSIAKRK